MSGTRTPGGTWMPARYTVASVERAHPTYFAQWTQTDDLHDAVRACMELRGDRLDLWVWVFDATTGRAVTRELARTVLCPRCTTALRPGATCGPCEDADLRAEGEWDDWAVSRDRACMAAGGL